MRRSISLAVQVCWILISLGGPIAHADDENPVDKALIQITQDFIREGRLDDALSRLATEKDASSNAIAGCYFDLSQAHFAKRNWKASLTLLETIIDKYPGSPVATLAPLGKAEVYLQSGDEAKMVATLERIIAAPCAETMLGVMDASNTHNRAYELLGGHYVRTRQWKRALDSYSRWRPSSWCGNCSASLQLRQKNALLICLVHTGNHAAAANAAWKTVANGRSFDGSASWHMAALTLIRLYEEAGQRDDLVRILDELSPPVLALGAGKRMVVAAPPPAAPDNRESIVSEMRHAIRLVRGTSGAARIDAFLAKPSVRDSTRYYSLTRPVAGWLLVRDQPPSVKQLVAGAGNGQHDMVALAEVLAAMDTAAARTALVTAAVRAGREHRDEVLAIIRAHCSKPEQVIARVAKTAKLSPADEIGPVHPGRGYFFAAWPKPEPGSLPKTLPADVLDLTKR